MSGDDFSVSSDQDWDHKAKLSDATSDLAPLPPVVNTGVSRIKFEIGDLSIDDA
jgi:hypothetical protein